MPGVKMHLLARRQFLRVDPDECGVVGRAGTLVGQPVGRDVDDVAVDDRDHPLLVGGEVHLGAHTGMDLVDVVDIDVGLGDEVVLARHDVHDLVAALDHRTDREHREVDDIAAIGRADLGAVEHVARRLQPRYDIGDLA